jgi:peptidoglycan/LPS O-acetylase OafA/YrhL
MPTVGAALIISADGAWLNRKILASSPAVLIGLIGYPLYLWHWPLLSFARSFDPEPSQLLRFAAIVAAISLALMTYGWIETPIRTGRRATSKIAILCPAMMVTGGRTGRGEMAGVPRPVSRSLFATAQRSTSIRAFGELIPAFLSRMNPDPAFRLTTWGGITARWFFYGATRWRPRSTQG